MIKDYYDYCKDRHKGSRAFVVGAGTSLYGLNIDFIHKDVVISINSSIILMPWEDGSDDKRYWISNDALCRKWNWWNKVKNSKSVKIVRNSWEKYFEELEGHNFYKFDPRKTPEHIVEENDNGLCYCSSVPSGIDLAMKMGCSEIVLLGVDQYMIGNKSHFWQFYPICDQPKKEDGHIATFSQQKWTFSYNDRAYYAISELAKSKNIKIYNANLKSRVNVFEKKDLSFFENLK